MSNKQISFLFLLFGCFFLNSLESGHSKAKKIVNWTL